MAAEGILGALESAARALEAQGIPHALIGGAALPAWGRIRATADADFLLGLSTAGKEAKVLRSRAIAALREVGFAHLEKADRRKLGEGTVLHFWYPLRDLGVPLRVDLIVSGNPADKEVLKRAVRRKVNGFPVPVASCEDLILLKLGAGRPVDLADARELFSINRERLDQEYLDSRAARRKLGRGLADIRREAK